MATIQGLGEPDQKTQAFLDNIKAQAASPPASPPPASGPSGGHGTGSGNAGGASGSGGSPPGDSTGSSNDSDGKPMNDQDTRKKVVRVMLVAASILGCLAGLAYIAAAYSALKMTTPEGMAQTDRMLAYSEKQEARRHAETMKDKEIQAMRIAAADRARARSAGETTPPWKAPTSMCATSTTSGSYRNPVRLTGGGCIVREATNQDMWLSFEAPPTKVAGDVWFNELDMVRGEDGKLHVQGTKDRCKAIQSSDNCTSWLSSKLGVALSVVHRGRMEITIN